MLSGSQWLGVADVHGLKRIAGLWPYLPAFRLVAELSHVTQAAERLGVSASAVSRSIAILEKHAGVALFTRSGRRITLTEPGERFLVAVRSAMRGIDDGLLEARGDALFGPLRVFAVEPFVTTMMPRAFEGLRRSHSGLIPTLVRCADVDVAHRLLEGAIDLAITRARSQSADLLSEPILEIETALYAAAHSRAAERRDAFLMSATDEIVDVTSSSTAPSLWPAEHPRRVALSVPDYDVALSMCAASELLAVLPSEMAEPLVSATRLVRLPIKTRSFTLFATRRSPLPSSSRAEALVAAIREAIATPPSAESNDVRFRPAS